MIWMRGWRRPAAGKRNETAWWTDTEGQAKVLARNVFSEYAAILVSVGLGIAMLPFNLAHLGRSDYGLWVLTTSIMTYFSMLDLGYGSAQVKFAAQYRALRDPDALNEIVSTLFFLFTAVAVVTYGAAAIIATNMGAIFNLTPEQAVTGRQVLLITSLYVALGFPFSVFGGVVNGFQRYYLNNTISIVSSVLVAIVNVAVLLSGYGIVALVAATTAIRILSLAAYCRTAYAAFPLLQVRWTRVRRSRLKEVTGFSAFLLIIDISAKINFSADTMVIGAVMGTAAVAVWAVGSRLIDVTRMLSRAVTHFLFPSIVDSATHDRLDHLQTVLIQGTRLSLLAVLPLAAFTALLAAPLISRWVGPGFAGAAPVVWILAVVVTIRMGTSTGTSILKGAGRHQFVAAWSVVLALSNLLLSLILVRWLGLPGVALGTLVPVALISILVLFPTSCRRVRIPIGRAIRRGVWPALWPIVPACVALRMSMPVVGESLILLAIAAAAAACSYLALFFWLGVSRAEREWYFGKIIDVIRGQRASAAAA